MKNLMLNHFEQVAVIAVDDQNDFCPGGSLAVTDGDLVIPALNRAMMAMRTLNVAYWDNASLQIPRASIFATRDWHPTVTGHFSETPDFKTTWPIHCVAGTKGAAFHARFDTRRANIIHKGTRADEDAYSGFDGRTPRTNRTIDEILHSKPENTALFIGGLATDYCVAATVMDAQERGYQTFIIEDGIKGVSEDTSRLAITEMTQRGQFITSEEIWSMVERTI